MNKIILVSALFLFFTACATKAVRPSFAPLGKQEHFSFQIMQSDQVMAVSNDTVILEKKPFQLVMTYSKPMGVLINVYTNEKLFLDFQAGKSMEVCFDGQQGKFMGMAEYDRNPEKELMLREGAGMYLYYDNPKDNRFDQTWINQYRQVVGVRTVEQITCFWDYSSESVVFSVADFPTDDIYLIFYLGDYVGQENAVELQRSQLHIHFKKK